jgi:energy-converting hydrogenase Eha subunit G
MPENVIVALIAFGGTLVGTFGGIVASSRLTNYRIKQLEIKVDKHNQLVERTFKLEESCSLICEKIKVVNHRIEDLEKGAKA